MKEKKRKDKHKILRNSLDRAQDTYHDSAERPSCATMLYCVMGRERRKPKGSCDRSITECNVSIG